MSFDASAHEDYVHDMLQALFIIQDRCGAPIQLIELPPLIAYEIQARGECFYTAIRISKQYYRFFLTNAGIVFLYGRTITVNIDYIAIKELQKDAWELFTLTRVFVRSENNVIREFPDLDLLPFWVMNALKRGECVAHNNATFGISIAQLRDESGQT
ncbi:hypothetical protein KBC54_04720 [Patescibacteria group bacterium]|nr:hypothetical protein [Patescibacteria group bacterium]